LVDSPLRDGIRGIVLRYFLTGFDNSIRIAYGQFSDNEKRLRGGKGDYFLAKKSS